MGGGGGCVGGDRQREKDMDDRQVVFELFLVLFSDHRKIYSVLLISGIVLVCAP